MPFPGEPKPWHRKLSKKEITAAARDIAARVADLKKRRDDLGAEKAFDPLDPETSAAFKRLWEVSFDKNYKPDDQQAIMNELDLRHRGTIDMMREIGHVSEKLMELGYAGQAFAAATKIPRTSLPQEWEELRKSGFINARRYEEAIAKGKKEDAAMAKKIQDEVIMPRFDELTSKRAQLLDDLTASFPFPTYELLAGTEATLLTGLKGLEEKDMTISKSHLFVEAGALPLTAINHVLTRRFNHVICTIGDEESANVATMFVYQLERLGVLEPGRVFILPISPKDPDFIHVLQGNGRGWHSATISQLVKGKDEVQRITALLSDKEKGLGIDTVIARGADGLVQMLYEPLADLTLPNGLRKRMTNVPVHAVPHDDLASGSREFHHTFPCYNTSHVYSSREVMPDFNPGDNIALFRGAAINQVGKRHSPG